ncbi:hypothetical protein C8F01DRAFT_468476 [Mycena amicta]|nr:hypothetical protein C8F01DRAFT_468476 [Mycena amicta]
MKRSQTSDTALLIADDALRTVHSASTAYPPLQAALGLAVYIQESIKLFQSNTKQIQLIGEYSTRLSKQLERAVDASKTTKFVQVVESIHEYLKAIVKKPPISRYLERRKIEAHLQSFRNSLWDEYLLFSITSTVDLQIVQQDAHRTVENAREAEKAGKEDELETHWQELIKKLAVDVRRTSAGTKQLAAALTLPSREGQERTREILSDLQKLSHDSSLSEAEAGILAEGIRLAQLCLDPNFKWYSNTFNDEHALSEIKDALSLCVDDIARDLSESSLLPRMTTIDIRHARNDFEKVTHLFRALDSRSGDVVLIRAFQLALVGPLTEGRMDSFVKPGLLASVPV